MPSPDAEQYDSRYLQGIEHFNQCEFFEAHEVWEDLWKDYAGEDRAFYQGLIQAAVALHHFGNENIRGARKLNVACRKYLDPYRPFHRGLDLKRFLDRMDRCFAEVMASTEEYPRLQIDVERIPEIHLEEGPDGESR